MGGRGTSGTRNNENFLTNQEIQDVADVVYDGIPKGATISLEYYETSSDKEITSLDITHQGEDNYLVKSSRGEDTWDKETVDEVIDGLFEDGLRVKTFNVVYTSKNEALNVALYSHPAQARGNEVFLVEKNGKYVVTTDKKKFKGWKEIRME